MGRKSDGNSYRLILEQSARLSKLDLRVLKGKARLTEAVLVTESGNKIAVKRFEATGVLDDQYVYASENFSLNEGIVEINLNAEGITDDAELFLTAVSDNVIPRLTVWHAPMNTTPSYDPNDFMSGTPVVRQSACGAEFCVNDVVIFNRQRAKIVKIYPDGRISLLIRGVRKVLTSADQIQKI
jgi:hypothetical protein